MAFTTYAELQAAIASWLARDDLTAYIPDFIKLFEASASRKLHVRLLETTTTLTPVAGVATLPTDYLGFRRVTWTGASVHELNYVTPQVYSGYIDSGTGIPTVFTIEGTNLRVALSDDTTITFDYFPRLAAVSGTLNAIFVSHPDAYLFGSLAEAFTFDKDYDQAGVWKARRDEVFDEIMKTDFNSPGAMAVRIIGTTP